ncbi:MAG: hypothetical protein L3J63_13510, partial [Geopsychrobacter sp.]|nr:hypothetical protein [Geopsychrobacter sp.]
DPICLLALIGIGISQFSISAPYTPKRTEFINLIDTVTSEKLAREALTMPDSKSIRALLAEEI